jgi:hypothetical protein
MLVLGGHLDYERSRFYEKHTQASDIDFFGHIIETFPFRIHEIRTDNGHEFQAKFQWHVEDKGSTAPKPKNVVNLAEVQQKRFEQERGEVPAKN